jgi:hypothetical protein
MILSMILTSTVTTDIPINNMECVSLMITGASDIIGSYKLDYPLPDLEEVMFSFNAMSKKNMNLYKSEASNGSFFIPATRSGVYDLCLAMININLINNETLPMGRLTLKVDVDKATDYKPADAFAQTLLEVDKQITTVTSQYKRTKWYERDILVNGKSAMRRMFIVSAVEIGLVVLAVGF